MQEVWCFWLVLQPQDLGTLQPFDHKPLSIPKFSEMSNVRPNVPQLKQRDSRYCNGPVNVQTSTWFECCGGTLRELFRNESWQTPMNRSNIVKKSGLKFYSVLKRSWIIGCALFFYTFSTPYWGLMFVKTMHVLFFWGLVYLKLAIESSNITRYCWRRMLLLITGTVIAWGCDK